MRRLIKWILILGASLGVGFALFRNTYVVFVPLRCENGRWLSLVPAPEMATDQFLRGFMRVLNRYGQPYKTNQAGAVFIKRSLAWDKELLWNFCTKATENSY